LWRWKPRKTPRKPSRNSTAASFWEDHSVNEARPKTDRGSQTDNRGGGRGGFRGDAGATGVMSGVRFWENHNPERPILESGKRKGESDLFFRFPPFFWHSLPSGSEISLKRASILSENHCPG